MSFLKLINKFWISLFSSLWTSSTTPYLHLLLFFRAPPFLFTASLPLLPSPSIPPPPLTDTLCSQLSGFTIWAQQSWHENFQFPGVITMRLKGEHGGAPCEWERCEKSNLDERVQETAALCISEGCGGWSCRPSSQTHRQLIYRR